jgi:hypothetical protein
MGVCHRPAPHQQHLFPGEPSSRCNFNFPPSTVNNAAGPIVVDLMPPVSTLSASFFFEELWEIAHLPNLVFSLFMCSKDSHHRCHPPLSLGCRGQLQPGRLRPYSFNYKLSEDPRELTRCWDSHLAPLLTELCHTATGENIYLHVAPHLLGLPFDEEMSRLRRVPLPPLVLAPPA